MKRGSKFLPEPRKVKCLRQVLLKGPMRPTVSERAGKNAGRTCPRVKSLTASTQLRLLGKKHVLGGRDHCSFLSKFSACRIPSLQRVGVRCRHDGSHAVPPLQRSALGRNPGFSQTRNVRPWPTVSCSLSRSWPGPTSAAAAPEFAPGKARVAVPFCRVPAWVAAAAPPNPPGPQRSSLRREAGAFGRRRRRRRRRREGRWRPWN